ncbi:uncharacterized protein LOC120337443 isoform X3 [Styela clava]
MENESMNGTADSDKLDTSRSSASEDSTKSPRAKVPYALHLDLNNKENEKGDSSSSSKSKQPTTPNSRTTSTSATTGQNKSTTKKPQTPTDTGTHVLRAPYAQPVLDASKLNTSGGGEGAKKSSSIEERLASARERRMQQQKQLELDLKLRRDRENQAHMKWLQGQEEKRRKIEENKMKDDQHRREVEMRKKQQLDEDKKKAEAKIAKTEQVFEVKMRHKRSSSSDRGNKRWSWGGGKAQQRPRSMHASHFDVSQLGRMFDDNATDQMKTGSMTNLASPSSSKPQNDRFSKSPLLINTTHMNFAMGLRSYEPHAGAGRGVSPVDVLSEFFSTEQDSPRIRRSNSLGARPKPAVKGPPSRTSSVENIALKKDETPPLQPAPTSSKAPIMRGRSPTPKVTLTTTAKIREQLAKNQKATSAGRPISTPGLTEPVTISPRLLAPTRASLARSRNAINDLDDSASQSSNTSGGHGPMRSRSKDRRTKDKMAARSDSGSSSPLVETAKSSPSMRKPTPERKATPTRGSSPMLPGKRAASPAQNRSSSATNAAETKKTATPENRTQKRGNSPASRRTAPSPARKPKTSTPSSDSPQTTPQRSTRGASPSPASGLKTKSKVDTPKSTSPNIKPSLRATNSTQTKTTRSSPANKTSSAAKTTKTQKPATPKSKTPDTPKQTEKPKETPKEPQKTPETSQDSGFTDASKPSQEGASIPNSVGATLSVSTSGEIPKSLSNTSQGVSEIPSLSETVEKVVTVEPVSQEKVGGDVPEKTENFEQSNQELLLGVSITPESVKLPHGQSTVENDLQPQLNIEVNNEFTSQDVTNEVKPNVESTIENDMSPKTQSPMNNDLSPQVHSNIVPDPLQDFNLLSENNLSLQVNSTMTNDLSTLVDNNENQQDTDSLEGESPSKEEETFKIEESETNEQLQATTKRYEPEPEILEEAGNVDNTLESENEIKDTIDNAENGEQKVTDSQKNEEIGDLSQTTAISTPIILNVVDTAVTEEQPDSLEAQDVINDLTTQEENLIDTIPENRDSLLDSFKTVEPQDPRAVSPTDSLEDFEPEPELPENTQEQSVEYLPPDHFDSESSDSESEEQVSVKENIVEIGEPTEKDTEHEEIPEDITDKLQTTDVSSEPSDSQEQERKTNEISLQKEEEEPMEKPSQQDETVTVLKQKEVIPPIDTQEIAQITEPEEVKVTENKEVPDTQPIADIATVKTDNKQEQPKEEIESNEKTSEEKDQSQEKTLEPAQQNSDGDSPPSSESAPAERKSMPRKALETEADKEAYRQAIAEKRRELKEKKEQEERERQERIRLAKIESQKREEEARKMFEEAAAEAEREKKEEEERAQRMIEDEKRREEEAIARKEAEKKEAAEKVKRDREAQKQKQEDERLARKKRLEMIMRRTRQPDATDSNKSQTDGSISPAGTPSPQHTPTIQSPASGRSPQTQSPVGGKSPITATTPERSVSPAVAAIINRSSNNYSPTTTVTSQSNSDSADNTSSNEQTLLNFSTSNYDSGVELIKIDAGLDSMSLDFEKPKPIEAFTTVKPISNGMKSEEAQNHNNMDPFNIFTNGSMDLQQQTTMQVSNGNQDLLASNNDNMKISTEPLVPTEI